VEALLEQRLYVYTHRQLRETSVDKGCITMTIGKDVFNFQFKETALNFAPHQKYHSVVLTVI